MTDAERETLIQWHSRHLLRCCTEGDREAGREHWRLMVELIAERSSAQVERMEQVFNDGASGPGWSADIRPADMPSPIVGGLKGE